MRDWTDEPVPDSLIEQIMEAGRAAPVGCNLDAVRFIVLRTPVEKSMIWSDISTDNAVIIVLCFDKRISATVGQDKTRWCPRIWVMTLLLRLTTCF